MEYFAWLDHGLNFEHRKDLDEYSATLKLNQLRYEKELNKGLSFPAISSIGPNAAVIHYIPKEGSAAALTNTLIYLLDSGGQYLYLKIVTITHNFLVMERQILQEQLILEFLRKRLKKLILGFY